MGSKLGIARRTRGVNESGDVIVALHQFPHTGTGSSRSGSGRVGTNKDLILPFDINELIRAVSDAIGSA